MNRESPKPDSLSSLTESPKQRTIHIMQLKLKIDDGARSIASKLPAEYGVLVSCNKCGGIHDTGIAVAMEEGPADKQSIADLYEGKTLPKILAELTNRSITCPKTGKQSIQKNNQQIFLVPTKS
jgi:hypothetical protein